MLVSVARCRMGQLDLDGCCAGSCFPFSPIVQIRLKLCAHTTTGAPAASNYSEWATSTVGTLTAVRAAVYEVVKPLGTVYTKGAFYFLVPVPAKVETFDIFAPLPSIRNVFHVSAIFQVGENEAIHILATEFGVLLTPGGAFGAPQHMRLSYGSIPPDKVPGAVQKLAAGVKHLLELSSSRLELSASRL